MDFPDPLLEGRLIARYKRFFADVELADGARVTAHCPNPGSMLGLAAPGTAVWLSPAKGAARKLAFGLELVDAGSGPVGVNTARTNAIVAEALASSRIPELSGYGRLRREVAMGARSRVDFLLEGKGRAPCYVEVKSVTLRRDRNPRTGLAEFPDAATARGARHLGELARLAQAGARAVMLYVVQRADCGAFALAADIDPDYAAAAESARAAGVETLCYGCRVSPGSITLHRPLPLHRPSGRKRSMS